ncbi:MAG: hypothetical protein ACHQDY_04310 [Solirubrobacterales bacterium]
MSTEPPYTRTPSAVAPGGASGGRAPSHQDVSTLLAREPCAGCGAPLGVDQRYCLSCGVPRSGTRLPFLDVLHSEAAAAGVVEVGSQPASLLRIASATPGGFGPADPGGWGARGRDSGVAGRLREYTPLFALLGVLLLALLIGLLLGHWAGGGSKTLAATPTRQVVEIKYPPGALAAPAASAPAPVATGTTSTPTPSSGGGGAKTSTSPTAHASNPTVNTLAQSTGKEHVKAVEKALSHGGSLSTGGAPPPKPTSKSEASKPIGGGSEVTSIE